MIWEEGGVVQGERGRDGEGERERDRLPPVCTLTRDGTCNLLVHGRTLQQTEPPSQSKMGSFYVSLRKQKHPRRGIEWGAPHEAGAPKGHKEISPAMQKRMARNPWNWAKG